MGYFSGGILKIGTFILVVLASVVMLPRFSPVIFPPVPEPSSDFDCDDGALLMYRHFQGLGIESTPIVGNLNMEGEEYLESDHVWLLVESGDRKIAYDWGLPRFDAQHYEGYTISLDYLLYAVAGDRKDGNALVAAEY